MTPESSTSRARRSSFHAGPRPAEILHLVLARTPGHRRHKGLSIFLYKFDFDAAGNLTGRNDVKVGKIEHKMGIHGSATRVMVFAPTGRPGAICWATKATACASCSS